MNRKMRIGTRKSALALAQTELFIEACRAVDLTGEISYEIVEMHTEGDRILDRPLYDFSGKGMFVSAFEEALLAGDIDIAVHSGKDMPAELPRELLIGAVLKRGNPKDVLVTLKEGSLNQESVVATGSLRRQAQVKRYFGCQVKGIRGNVGTRLQKLAKGEADALILAAAGLERLGFLPQMGSFIWEGVTYYCHCLKTEDFLPAPAQGIIAVECRQDSGFLPFLQQVCDTETMDEFLAERAFLKGVGADCHQPVAALAKSQNGLLNMQAAYFGKTGVLHLDGQMESGCGEQLGWELARRLLSEKGRVYLVGAGPGDAGLITVKGMTLLQDCDVLVYDRLCSRELIEAVKPDCERIYAGKQAGGDSMPQEEINRILVQKAGEGKLVVRLKGGDPFVFGRGGEEAEYLRAAGISFTVVPGVTSAVAAPELAGIPVTHRNLSRSFHVITAHKAVQEKENIKDYLKSQLAGLRGVEGTLVFLMGLSELETIAELLPLYGWRKDTPAAVIENASLPTQRVVRGMLSDIAAQVRKAGLASPAVILVGETAALSLAGELEVSDSCRERIGIVGTEHFYQRLSKRLHEAGKKTSWIQELGIRPLDGQEKCFAALGAYTWIVFTSSYGVTIFFEQMKRLKLDMRSLLGKRFAVIGPGTGAALSEQLFEADLLPEPYTAEALAGSLSEKLQKEDRVLLYQAENGNPVIEETLRKAQIKADRFAAYETFAGVSAPVECFRELSQLIFGSSYGVRLFLEQYPGAFESGILSGIEVWAIGEQTAKALRAAGCKNCRIPDTFCIDGLLAQIKEQELLP